jgi:hypothetical protein
MMKKFLMVLVLVLFAIPAFSIPQQIYFQGILLDDNDEPVSGAYVFTFRIYDASAGGTELWEETHTSVQVSNGLYTVKLGSVDPLNSSVFDGDTCYIGVQVDTDAEMSPRVQLLSVPFAHRAQYAETAAGAISTAEADSRYVFKAGDTMTGILTMEAGQIRSDVSDSQTAIGFSLRTNQELKTPNPVTYFGPTLLSIYSGKDATQETFGVFDIDYDTTNKYRGIKIPSHYDSPDFYIMSGILSGSKIILVGDVFNNNRIEFNKSSSNNNITIGTDTLTLNATIGSFMLPSLDANYNIGDPTARWNRVYAVEFRGDGSNLTGIGYTSGEADAKYVYKSGDMMTGILTISSDSIDRAIHVSAGQSGAYGGYFNTSGNLGRAVYGDASATGSITNYGGYFLAQGDDGIGVYGRAPGNSANYGGYFWASGSSARGVYGRASHPDGTTYGGYFTSYSDSGHGLLATNEAGTSGGNYAMLGTPDHAGFFHGNITVESTIFGDDLALAGMVTSEGGEFRSNVPNSEDAIGFALRTNNVLYQSSVNNTASLLSVFSGASATQEALKVVQVDDASNIFRGIILRTFFEGLLFPLVVEVRSSAS